MTQVQTCDCYFVDKIVGKCVSLTWHGHHAFVICHQTWVCLSNHVYIVTCVHVTITLSSTLIGWKRHSWSKFASRYAWRTNIVCECKMDVKSTCIPTWHQVGHVSWSLGLFLKSTSTKIIIVNYFFQYILGSNYSYLYIYIQL